MGVKQSGVEPFENWKSRRGGFANGFVCDETDSDEEEDDDSYYDTKCDHVH